jgi:hypothetical protein
MDFAITRVTLRLALVFFAGGVFAGRRDFFPLGRPFAAISVIIVCAR